jgi:integrase
MKLTAMLRPSHVAATMRTLIGLLAATGLRSGEAVALNVSDLRVDEGVLHVMGKYAKPRVIPLHQTTVEALSAYLVIRATVSPSTDALLVAQRGGRLNANTARGAFRVLVDTAHLAARPGSATPRLHDLRHLFAVNSLIDAHRRGGDVDAAIAALVSYLGHVNPRSTYWYLTASPELMAIVSGRIATYHGRLS